MLRRLCIALVTLMALGAGCAQAQAPGSTPESGRYELDPHHASITFRVNHLGFSHVVARFDRFAATLELNAATPSNSSLNASVEPASVSSGVASFDDFLRGERFLNATTFPEMRFVSRSVERTGDATARVTGDFTMHGVTRPVTLNVVLNAAGRSPFEPKYVVGFSATGALTRSEWQLGAFAPMVGDAVEFQIEAEFARPVL